jgi:hypothetical protein
MSKAVRFMMILLLLGLKAMNNKKKMDHPAWVFRARSR